MRDRVMLKIADSARVDDIESPLEWYALHLRSVAFVEVSGYRCPDMLSFVWKSFGLSWRFHSSALLHTKLKMSATPPSIG